MSAVLTPGNYTSTSGGLVPAGFSAHVIAGDYTIADGTTSVVVRYVEIAAGVTLEIGADSDLEIS